VVGVFHERTPAPAPGARGERPQSIEGRRLPNAARKRTMLLDQRGHTGLVIERSAVRADERVDHPLVD
jgi:hypothetical protein